MALHIISNFDEWKLWWIENEFVKIKSQLQNIYHLVMSNVKVDNFVKALIWCEDLPKFLTEWYVRYYFQQQQQKNYQTSSCNMCSA